MKKLVKRALLLWNSGIFLLACQHGTVESNSVLQDRFSRGRGNESLQASYKISQAVLLNSKERTTSSSYLAMGVQFDPVSHVFKDIQRDLGVQLKSRGESHITVMTPDEFGKVKHKANEAELRTFIEGLNIQQMKFTPVCIGTNPPLGGKATYFIVVDGSELIEARQKIRDQFQVDIDPSHFYPHITIGFTHRDLHEQDGVIKDRRSCVSELTLE